MSHHGSSDADLIAEILKGREAAFTALMRRHKTWLYLFVRRHTPTADPVTLGRFRDDIVDKRTAFVLPPATTGDVTLHPSYTESNEFAIRAAG